MFDRDLKLWFDEAKADGNPYLTEWLAVAVLAERRSALFMTDMEAWRQELTQSYTDGTHEFAAREMLVRKYAWAVPCEAALALLAKLAPLVEVGAGTGYWAWLLRKRGVDIVAYDHAAPVAAGDANREGNQSWTSVLHGTPEVLAAYSDRTLFLCWPDYASPMAAACLKHYGGKTVVFVGEGDGGCTGDDEFWALLERDYHEPTEEIDLPQFEAIHDYLRVYVRRAPAGE